MQSEIAATFRNLETSSDFIRAYWGYSEMCEGTANCYNCSNRMWTERGIRYRNKHQAWHLLVISQQCVMWPWKTTNTAAETPHIMLNEKKKHLAFSCLVWQILQCLHKCPAEALSRSHTFKKPNKGCFVLFKWQFSKAGNTGYISRVNMSDFADVDITFSEPDMGFLGCSWALTIKAFWKFFFYCKNWF